MFGTGGYRVRFSGCAEHINIGTQIARSFFCAFAWTDHLNTFFRQTQPGGSFVQIRKSETINVSDFITMLKSKHVNITVVCGVYFLDHASKLIECFRRVLSQQQDQISAAFLTITNENSKNNDDFRTT